MKKAIKTKKPENLESQKKEIPICKETVILYGQNSVSVEGCKKILLYTPEKIQLELSRKALSILGSRLSCISFSGRYTGIQGKIQSVVFEKKEEGK